MTIQLPNDVNKIIHRLERAGYEAYAVGGCVRDVMLGLEPNDWDITTSARPETIKSVFADCRQINLGEKHGTICVVRGGESYEITTYRVDGEYLDNRHPSNVSFSTDINEDLARRDFTINAMAYNPVRGLVDPFNGKKDLQYEALRCVGEPDLRFNEDGLRILRGLRFASVYNLTIEPNTAASIMKNRKLLSNIANERIAAELNKLLCGTNAKFILSRYKDVFAVFLPELVSTFDCTQNTPHHNRTVWRHLVASVANIEADSLLRMTMLLHDVGKPLAKKTDNTGRDHFNGHNRYSAVLAKNALERLHYPSKFIDDAVELIECHDIRFNGNIKTIKHTMNRIGAENFEKLLKVQLADVMAQSRFHREQKLDYYEQNVSLFREIVRGNECYSLRQLAINGSDLIHLGITEGKEIGSILNLLLDSVIDGEIENDTIALKKKALEIYSEERRMKNEE